MAKLTRSLHPVEHSAHPLEIVGGIDARRRRVVEHHDLDRIAVGHRPQLLEGFPLFQGRRREAGVALEETRPVSVEADVAIGRQARRQRAAIGGEGVPCAARRADRQSGLFITVNVRFSIALPPE